jgi:hypothetical protein
MQTRQSALAKLMHSCHKPEGHMGLAGGRNKPASSLFGLAAQEASVAALFNSLSPLLRASALYLALGGLGCGQLHLACCSLACLCAKGLPIREALAPPFFQVSLVSKEGPFINWIEGLLTPRTSLHLTKQHITHTHTTSPSPHVPTAPAQPTREGVCACSIYCCC